MQGKMKVMFQASSVGRTIIGMIIDRLLKIKLSRLRMSHVPDSDLFIK